jgi:hypothetical protein
VLNTYLQNIVVTIVALHSRPLSKRQSIQVVICNAHSKNDKMSLVTALAILLYGKPLIIECEKGLRLKWHKKGEQQSQVVNDGASFFP